MDDDKVRGGKPSYNPMEAIRLEHERRFYQRNKAYFNTLMNKVVGPLNFKPIFIGTGGEANFGDISKHFYNPGLRLCDEYKHTMIMEENTKYYTPTIDEFYEGFEFEYLNIVHSYPAELTGSNKLKITGEGVETSSWDKATYYSNFFAYPDADEEWGVGNNLKNYIEIKEVRVKRLGIQDLEELGFLSTEKEHVFKHKQWIIRVVNWCHVNGAAMYLTEYLDAANINIVFKGFARNKSELSKILKLVGHGR